MQTNLLYFNPKIVLKILPHILTLNIFSVLTPCILLCFLSIKISLLCPQSHALLSWSVLTNITDDPALEATANSNVWDDWLKCECSIICFFISSTNKWWYCAWNHRQRTFTEKLQCLNKRHSKKRKTWIMKLFLWHQFISSKKKKKNPPSPSVKHNLTQKEGLLFPESL